MANHPWTLGILLSSLLAGCAKDSGTAPSTFSSSDCKKDTAASTRMARVRSLKVIDNAAGLDGLACVAWQRVGDGELLLDLYNFEGACGAEWAGDARLAADGTLAVHIDNPSCRIAACGSCLYDWSLDLQLRLPAGQPVALDVAVDACAGQQTTQHVSAAIGPEEKGIRCGLASYRAMGWQAATLGTCGQLNMPCQDSLLCGTGSATSTGTCSAGLRCDSTAAADQPVCLIPCATVADCPRADVYACQAAACRPTGLLPAP
jgi:hypothetical protein